MTHTHATHKVYIPFTNPHYSPSIEKKVNDEIGDLFSRLGMKRDFQELSFCSSGKRSFTIVKNSDHEQVARITCEANRVIVYQEGAIDRNIYLDGMRKLHAFKELRNLASDLEVINIHSKSLKQSDDEIHEIIKTLPNRSHTAFRKVTTMLGYGADISRVTYLLFWLGSHTVGALANLQLAFPPIWIVYGLLLIAKNIATIVECSKRNEVDGGSIVSRERITAILLILEGLSWMGLGVAMIVAPQLAATWSVISWVLFGGGYLLEGAVNVWCTIPKLNSASASYFIHAIWKNSNLKAPEDRDHATTRLFKRILSRCQNHPHTALSEEDLNKRRIKAAHIFHKLGLTPEQCGALLQKGEIRFEDVLARFQAEVVDPSLSNLVSVLLPCSSLIVKIAKTTHLPIYQWM